MQIQRTAVRVPEYPGWVHAYVRLVTGAKTVNQLNAVHILFENRMAPEEEAMLYRYITGWELSFGGVTRFIHHKFTRLRDRFLTSSNLGIADFTKLRRRKQLLWAYSLRNHSSLAGIRRKTSLRRHWSRSGGSLYLSSKPVATLIVAVSGGKQRMGLRAPTFLRFMENYPAHVLLLTGARGRSYDLGAPGFGDSPAEVASFIRELQVKHGAPSVRVVGISKGTRMAISLAGLLRADALLLASPVSLFSESSHGRWAQQEVGKPIEEIEWASTSLTPTIVFASDLEADQKAAEQIQSVFRKSRAVRVPDVPHAVFWPLARRGSLRSLFDQSLGRW